MRAILHNAGWLFFLYYREQEMIGTAIIPIAAGHHIGKTNWALIMAMHMHQLNGMPTEYTLLDLHTMKLFLLR